MHFALTALLVLTAHASTATDALQSRDKEIRAELPPEGQMLAPAKREKLQQTLVHLVDFEGIAKAALGKSWETQSAAKRKKFLLTFTTRFKRAAGEQLDFYRQSGTKFGAEEKQGADVKVPTELTVKGEPTHVDYRMRQVKGEWRIEDITIDDVSTVEDYRAAFQKIIKEQGFDALIAKLNKTEAAAPEPETKK